MPLKEGAEQAAVALLASGPPFNPGEAGFERHAVYLTAREAVFVFEGSEAEWALDDLVDDAFHPLLQNVLDRWVDLVDGKPRRARAVYSWVNEGEKGGAS